MRKPQKRGNSYYLDRLEKEHPAIHAEFKAGKFPSALKAFEAAGLKVRRSRLLELKNAWDKASAEERREFASWLRARRTRRSPAKARVVAVDGYLEEWAKTRITEIVNARKILSGDMMEEMGFSRLDTSVFRALARSHQIKPEVVSALAIWIDANAHVKPTPA